MLILSIETTGPLASAAIYDDGIVSFVQNDSGFSHLQECVPLVSTLLEEDGLSPESIDAIAVSCGPGSFTGIRIGMATAKGLAQVWNKPIVEVSTLESFAWADLPFTRSTLICPVFDARRSQVYAAAFRRDIDRGSCCIPQKELSEVKTVVPEGAYALDEYLDLLKEAAWDGDTLLFFGDGSIRFEEAIREALEAPCCGEGPAIAVEFAAEEYCLQRADSVAVLGAKLFAEGKVKDCFTAQPNYLRAAEPDRKKEKA